MGVAKKPPCGAVPARVALAMLTSAGVVMLYVLRINMSVAIVAMVKPIPLRPSPDDATGNASAPLTAPTPYCIAATPSSAPVNVTVEAEVWSRDAHNGTEPGSAEPDDGSYQLSLTGTEKGMVLGAFFYGYFATNIPGGRLAEEYGTKKVFGGSILISGVLTLLTPVAARVHYVLLILLRALIGLVNGVVYPAMNVMVSRWIPPLERPRFMSFTYMSNTLGTIITLPVCAVVADTMGWPAVFYISGAASLVWVAAWALLMHDCPSEHPRISQEEKRYILDAISKGTTKNKPRRTPWKAIICSVPLWATTTAHIGSMFGFNLLLTQLPSYMDSILGFSITSNGLLSALPFLSQFLGSTGSGVLGDWLLTKGYLTVHTSRRLFNTTSLLLPGIILVVVGYAGCNTALAVALLCLGSGFSGGICSGHLANHLDLSPNFSGTILGLSNTLAYMVSMCVPVIVGAMTPGQTLQEWQTVFWMTGVMYTVTWLVFLAFSSTEIQSWNYGEDHQVEKKRKPDGGDANGEGVQDVEEKKLFLSSNGKPQIV
ncbi:sialin-like [Eriocheir sinensis]|uniref:sialin-like n=1 Tax=Eriocheir sinensis TaxID=95602 RepID=UPI0021CAD674|nr:sialin-like [Eriocheir sinensis]